MTPQDENFMRQCLNLAKLGMGSVSPNPMVGCVVLDKDGNKVGEGYHQAYGKPHAEPNALDKAGKKAEGGTLYVNLEPCNHTGKTPPCTERVIKSGVKRVVFGLQDPNPKVDGIGVKRLQEAGIEVVGGVLENECRALNKTFCHVIKNNTPYLTLKMAMTLNGKIATRHRESQWITSDTSRKLVHEMRYEHDAILTTADTVAKDNPMLNVRIEEKPNIDKQPVRVILDRRFKLDPDRYQVFDTSEQETWVITSDLEHREDHAEKARQKGVKIIAVPERAGRLDLNVVMNYLKEHNISSVMTEAGGRLAGSLMTEGLVSEYVLFYGAKIIPDAMAKDAFSGEVCHELNALPAIKIISSMLVDGDLMVTALPV